MNEDRKMVTLRKVKEVLPIEGADKIEIVRIDGWSLVSGKGNFKAGDWALFHEIDSFVDTSRPQYKFLEKNNITWNNKVGARIKTIKLRGCLSQGLALPVSDFPEIYKLLSEAGSDVDPDYSEIDFSETVGVCKWEKLDTGMFGRVYKKSNWPEFLQKTDQERIQNLYDYIDRATQYEVTQKMDGSSMTLYWRNGVFGVCSRNWDVEEDENTFWRAVGLIGGKDKLSKVVNNIALQGELVGPGVNGNQHKFKELDYYVFNVFDIDTQTYLNPLAARGMCEALGFKYVPVLEYRQFDFENIEAALKYAEDVQNGEGVVFKKCEPHCILSTGKKEAPHSWKIISNKYLLATDG